MKAVRPRLRGLIYRPLNWWQVLVWWVILICGVVFGLAVVVVVPLEVMYWFNGTSLLHEAYLIRHLDRTLPED